MTDNSSLLEQINAPGFEPLECIDLIRRHSNDIGILFHLVSKLRTFKYDDVEFLIPQLLQIVVTSDSKSMALEDFLLDYCETHSHFGLIVFWNLQALVFELKDSPDSQSFQTVRNMVNKLQDILFNPCSEGFNDFKENLDPALVLCGALAASFGLPSIHGYTVPLIKSQGKQSKSFVFKLANFQKSLTQNLTQKNKQTANQARLVHSDDEAPRRTNTDSESDAVKLRYSESSARSKRKLILTLVSEESDQNTSDDDEQHYSRRLLREMVHIDETIEQKGIIDYVSTHKVLHSSDSGSLEYSQSMPDLLSIDSKAKMNTRNSRKTSHELSPRELTNRLAKSTSDPKKILKTLYFKGVTEFILALQNISLRLSQLPKEARLSALRAELTIINDRMLPAEIDIPQLLPVTSTRKKFHKLLKLSINDACVLNSAERVPFLLFVEFLSDELDFNPKSEANKGLIKGASTGKASTRKEKPALAAQPIIQSQSFDGISQVEIDISDMRVSTPQSAHYDLANYNNASEKQNKATKSQPAIYNNDATVKSRADQMRIAAVMLQQLESSGQAMSEQTIAIKERIVQSMIDLQDQFDSIDFDKYNDLKSDGLNAGERKLENDFKLAEDWKSKKNRIRALSPYGHLPNWDLCSVIVKNGSDLPQEAFACQLIAIISKIWFKRKIPCWTKRMKILITSANTGLVETITNAISVHSIKKSLTEHSIVEGENVRRKISTLKDYFVKVFGEESSPAYRRAQENFTKSLASYSIICYFLQIKDRHNGNIMIDDEGHIIHIDFGFLLSNSPGSVGFEAAPFKLTSEYVDLMDGTESDLFQLFKKLCTECFLSLREEGEQIINMVELMQKDSTLPCFNNGENTSVLLKQRLQLHLSETEAAEFVETVLIGKSLGSMYTRLYDQFQLITQGIFN
ncbi:hypothetical protein PUMCH_005182 [Australozyma saopauloensis]|uniref:1-phosphatidylinositol 4-kinase n=1 Tax=Australozyma saopauloensis TaxID=291208 RepID=A0AAX4HGP4_9ASCO|nr:hypothetical protein PUMCH_005182 [[Candida] saopauloensis]